MTEEHVEHHRVQNTGRFLRGVIAGLLVAVVIALALDNREDVPVHWITGDGDAPGAVVLVITAAAGALIGWLVSHRPHRHH